MITLNVEKRDMKVKPKALRQKGLIPAVFYGPKEETTPVTVSLIEFKKVWKKAGESSVIILKEGKNEHEVLIHDLDIHPLSSEPRHVDFYVIEKGKKVRVSVPIIFEGIAPAVKDKGGILVKVQRELEIEAAPRDLPHDIKVDISSLIEVTDVIKAGDLKLSAGVELKVSADDVIASIAVAKEEVEEVVAVDLSTIEVEAKGKEVKEGEEGVAQPDAKVESKGDAKK